MLKNSLKKAALATAITASLGAGSVANASILDQPVFQILGAVVVWGGDGSGSNGMVRDFIIDNGSGGVDLIGGTALDVTPVMTGSLDSFSPVGLTAGTGINMDTDGNGVVDASDTMAEFGPGEGGLNVDASAAQTSSFYVASNTVFNITATATGTGDSGSLAAIERTMSVDLDGDDGIPFGSAAKLPYSDAVAAFPGNGAALTSLTGVDVFVGEDSTAAATGSIAQQSVRFTNTYSLTTAAASFANGPATYSADVTYTIAIP